MESNIKGLVAAGHEMASELKAECGAVDMRSVAKLISDLATQLEVQLVRANALAEDQQKAIESIKQADAAVKLAHEKFSALAAENAGLKAFKTAVYQQMGVGCDAPEFSITTGLSNLRRFADTLHAIEREFFTKELPDEEHEGETFNECPLSWGMSVEQYVSEFRKCLAEVRAQGVNMARNAMIDFVDGEVGPNKNVPGLIRGAEICVSIAEQLRKGGNQ
ncbi:TPA: eae-like domain protein [Escherichia coli]|uniref:eae-like domain protein n=1 Tax=Escherichia coli TaxID=562 RepID=UPI0018534966|nr:eae-like domain protein [Escherichia coli]ELX6411490.1 eae-like domain protein [Escherichia coli]HAJ0017123.1 eae-like domain protein [Escherichia coli]HAL7655250.1 eae-like domain protein [Escherichia coli]HAN2058294.1 eae-like domain protein [Escherichia coli]HAX8396982.1 eae-like domain protein [Escherichia coli]